MSARPKGAPISKFVLPISTVSGFAEAVQADIQDAAYAAALSYADAIRGLIAGNPSWALIKLYYSAFYNIRLLLLLDGIIPFHCGEYYLCDSRDGAVKRGGKSSHQWQWNSLRDFRRSGWYYSVDSSDAYDRLKAIREDANYRFGFIDPNWHRCLAQVSVAGIPKSFRTYRDDGDFTYTYLDDHVSFAYPTKILYAASSIFLAAGHGVSEERQSHLKKTWPLKDKPPLF